MKKEYIEREAALNMLNRFFRSLDGNETQVLVSDIKHAALELPTADVVEVVRCKDCIYNKNGNCEKSEFYTNEYRPDYYCADGERKILMTSICDKCKFGTECPVRKAFKKEPEQCTGYQPIKEEKK